MPISGVQMLEKENPVEDFLHMEAGFRSTSPINLPRQWKTHILFQGTVP